MSQQYYFPAGENQIERQTIVHRLAPFEEQFGAHFDAPERVSARKLFLHTLLLVLTAGTTTAMGTFLFFGGADSALQSGILFSFTLLVILGAHEMGHYIACRWYRVRATLPFFIPVPVGIGTFGAFIKIKSPIPNRRALFDIGIAGPIAGFIFALPAAIIANVYAATAPPTDLSDGYIVFHSPLLFQLLERWLSLPANIELNPVWFASWVGLLMTSLNLLPVGQLDGGHVVYAVLGRRAHKLLARVILIAVIGMALHAIFSSGWIGWVVYAVLLTLVLRVGHPPVNDEYEKLGSARLLVAIFGLIIFILCFMPVPITVVT